MIKAVLVVEETPPVSGVPDDGTSEESTVVIWSLYALITAGSVFPGLAWIVANAIGAPAQNSSSAELPDLDSG